MESRHGHDYFGIVETPLNIPEILDGILLYLDQLYTALVSRDAYTYTHGIYNAVSFFMLQFQFMFLCEVSIYFIHETGIIH